VWDHTRPTSRGVRPMSQHIPKQSLTIGVCGILAILAYSSWSEESDSCDTNTLGDTSDHEQHVGADVLARLAAEKTSGQYWRSDSGTGERKTDQ
jgi:hypothetical protein